MKAVNTATGDANHSIVRLVPGTYAQAINVAGGGAITIVGTGATLAGNGSAFMCRLDAGANVTIRGITFTGSAPLYCTGATTLFAMQDVTMTVNDEAMIDSCHATLRHVSIDPLLNVYNTTLSADQCKFSGTKTPNGLGVNGSDSNSITVTNSVISEVILAETGSNTVAFSYDTIYGRLGVEADSMVPSGVIFQDSIIAGSASAHPDSARCSTCSFMQNVIFPQSTAISTNIEMDPKLADPANGNLHLGSGSPAIDASDSAADNHDYDGTTRPQGPSNDIGAFEFKP